MVAPATSHRTALEVTLRVMQAVASNQRGLEDGQLTAKPQDMQIHTNR